MPPIAGRRSGKEKRRCLSVPVCFGEVLSWLRNQSGRLGRRSLGGYSDSTQCGVRVCVRAANRETRDRKYLPHRIGPRVSQDQKCHGLVQTVPRHIHPPETSPTDSCTPLLLCAPISNSAAMTTTKVSQLPGRFSLAQNGDYLGLDEEATSSPVYKLAALVAGGNADKCLSMARWSDAKAIGHPSSESWPPQEHQPRSCPAVPRPPSVPASSRLSISHQRTLVACVFSPTSSTSSLVRV